MSEEKPGSALAERLKAGIEEAEAEKRRSALDRERQESSAKQRRSALMSDLESFGQAIAHLRITHRWGALILRYQSRSLRFKADGTCPLWIVKCCVFRTRGIGLFWTSFSQMPKKIGNMFL